MENSRHTTPSDIERTSMKIIAEELAEMGIELSPIQAPVIMRAVHASADFDYAKNLKFSENAVKFAVDAIRSGKPFITDTNMAKSGISKAALSGFGSEAVCYMADPDVAEAAKKYNTTRAVASVRKAAEVFPEGIFAVGNAPTALFELKNQIEQGKLNPSLIVAVPVGFVNVVEAKEEIFEFCTERGIPVIAAMGRKGGSTIATAICNALLYMAAEMTDPSARGWN